MQKQTRLDLADLSVESFFPEQPAGPQTPGILASNYDSRDFCSGDIFICSTNIGCSTGCRLPTNQYEVC